MENSKKACNSTLLEYHVMDELPFSNENGIVRRNIREWVLDM